MGCLASAIPRFFQLVGLLAILAGIGNIPPLVAAIRDGLARPAWPVVEIAPRIAAAAAPILMGLAFVIGFETFLRWATAGSRLQAAHPGQPWLWRQDWAERRIRLSNRVALILLPICWGMVLLVAAPLAATHALTKNQRGLTIFLSLFVGGLALILAAFTKQAWLNRRWNRSELQLGPLPGVIGGPISGIILLRDTFPEGTAFRVTLLCERTTTQRRAGSSGSSSIHSSVAWQQQRVLDRTIDSEDPGTTVLPFRFAIDYDCQPTGHDTLVRGGFATRRTTNESIRWYVKVALTEDRQMRDIKFEVPVFKTPASSPDYIDNESALEPYLARPDAERVLQRRAFTDEPVPRGRRLTFGLFSWGLVLGLLVLCGLCGAGTVAIAISVPLPLSLFAGLIPAVLTLIGLYCLAEVLLWGSAVTILEDRIELEGGWLGFRRRATSERDRPPRLVAREQFKKENGAWWSVEARLDDGPPITLVQRLDGQQEAAAVRAWFETQFEGAAR